jgi:hypothetical protein
MTTGKEIVSGVDLEEFENDLGSNSAVVIGKSDGQSLNQGPNLMLSEVSEVKIEKNSDFPNSAQPVSETVKDNNVISVA